MERSDLPMILADRLNRIIEEQNLTKKEFAEKMGITEQYVYLLTGNSKKRPDKIAPALAKLIALEFGYDAEWILHGNQGTV
ncbi:MAG: helix-turn-helix transcriptional regulator [Ruminococcaceae bacterium]|nr:helix-turn-helix transcriptional regulator [Oscillospiraceae bacterium]